MTLTLTEVSDLKKALAEHFSVRVHFHDGCGGQYFSVDRPTEELKAFVSAFLAEKDLNAVFSEDGGQFAIRRKCKGVSST